MENYVAGQLECLGQALLLGLVSGVAYDLLRAVRLRWRYRWLTHVSDALYAVALGLAVFLFAMGRGQGELRLYMLGGIAVGSVVYFVFFSCLIRPLWEFWTDTAAALADFLWRPVAWIIEFIKKAVFIAKKYFYFFKKYATIKKYLSKHRNPKNTVRGGRCNEKRQKKKNSEKRQKA